MISILVAFSRMDIMFLLSPMCFKLSSKPQILRPFRLRFRLLIELLPVNFSNAKVVLDTNLNGYINKKKSNGKIDMVAALINAMVFWEKEFAGELNIYESEDEREAGFIII